MPTFKAICLKGSGVSRDLSLAEIFQLGYYWETKILLTAVKLDIFSALDSKPKTAPEIAARIADEAFAWLDAPVRRVAATDTFVAYAPELEDVILPQVESLREAIASIAAF